MVSGMVRRAGQPDTVNEKEDGNNDRDIGRSQTVQGLVVQNGNFGLNFSEKALESFKWRYDLYFRKITCYIEDGLCYKS